MNDEDQIVTSYASFEEMIADQKAKEDEANAAVLPIQHEKVVWGSYAVALYKPTRTWIYGKIWTREELREKNTISLEEAKEYGYASVEEFMDSEMDRWNHIYERGYRTGVWYSSSDPLTAVEGEIGDHHVSALWPISEEDFLAANAAGWVHSDLEEKILREHHDYLSTFTDK